jgi:hypothetical protein
MLERISYWGTALLATVAFAAGQAACGSTAPTGGGLTGTTSGGGSGGNATTSSVTTDSEGSFVGVGVGGAGQTTGGSMQGLDVQPADPQTITVAIGQATPTVDYKATVNGSPANVAWSIDRGDVGSITTGPASSTSFTPKGKSGGVVTVIAGFNGKTVKRQILVKLTAQQNGPTPGNAAEQAQIPTDPTKLTAGGGVGGVGGEGLGGQVPDTTVTVLGSPTSNGTAEGLRFLYPYDKTVFPRGMLAPLLMWTWATNDADAIQIELATTSGSFTYKGTFSRPAILAQTKGAFIRHPIPQDIWEMATNTAGGLALDGTPDKLTMKLTIAKGGKAYGPLTETWIIAPARLSGTIYYNSYGTQLAQNYGGAVGGNGKFGGAVLSIHVGDTGPKLTAGANGTEAQCRVCHSVAANGSRLVVQHGDASSITSVYDLGPAGASEHAIGVNATFPAIYPDGSMALTAAGALVSLAGAGSTLPSTGITSVATNLGTPAFSPNGALVTFNPMASASVTYPTQKLLVMSFDAGKKAFSAPVVVVDDTGKPAETRPGWPAFFPDGTSVVFHHQSVAGFDGNGSGAMATRKGARAQIAWTSVKDSKSVTALDQLNGKDASGAVYLPKLSAPIAMTCTGDGKQVGSIDADHGNDVNLNYEPTVNPVASGGYAWVVFTSRRMYGSVASIPPFCSDPRGVDLIKNITTKKLWVAAVDLGAQPGTDASHPAFYLPAQELLAGNARGFWVLDPCRQDGQGCDTGDQCCNGFCEPNGQGGALVCSNMPPDSQCSMPQEKCSGAADCCDPNDLCINGFCSLNAPPK